VRPVPDWMDTTANPTFARRGTLRVPGPTTTDLLRASAWAPSARTTRADTASDDDPPCEAAVPTPRTATARPPMDARTAPQTAARN
jgi:hypothetical protein